MTAIDIIKKWMDYIHYDPEKKSWNLLSNEYDAHKSIKLMEKISAYDPSGAFSVLYAKQLFETFMKNKKISALDVLSKPDILAPEQEMWRVFQSKDVLQVEDALLSSFDQLIQKIIPTKLLGSRDKNAERESLYASVEGIVEELPTCNEELFLRGGVFKPVTNYSTHIHLFERLADCLLALEQAPDGMYLCYIRQYDSADGYFGYFIKNNGNILSINERVQEGFPGEHTTGHGDNRWVEQKKYGIFPYSKKLFKMASPDYKGFYTKHIIDEEALAFFNLEPEVYMPIVIAMLMLNGKYAGTTLTDKKLSYVDSLLPKNLALPTPDTQEILVPDNSLVVAGHKDFVIPFTDEGILHGTYAKDYTWNSERGNTLHWSERGEFPTEELLFAQLYGEGFVLDAGKLLEANAHLKRLASSELATNKKAPNPEFVGSVDRMRMVAYKEAREQLAEYIRDKMFEEYTNFGGISAVREWHKKAVIERKEWIWRECIRRYQETGASKPDQIRVTINYGKNGKPKYDGPDYTHFMPFNERVIGSSNWNPEFTCPVTGNKASIFFTFNPYNWKELEQIVGDNTLPKIVKGWERNGHHGYGNPNLRATDAVSFIGTPFEYYERRQNKRYNKPHTHSLDYKFQFTVGFSKRGLTQLIKEYGEGDGKP